MQTTLPKVPTLSQPPPNKTAGPTRREAVGGMAVAAAAAATSSGLAAPSCASVPDRARGPGASSAAAPHPGGTAVTEPVPGSLTIRGGRFLRDGRPFPINGFNYWSALPLSRAGNDAGWDQVRRDLDALQSLGINMLRVLGASEGPDREPYRIVPALQPAPRHYDPAGIAGLLRLVDELQRRKLVAILVMNNFWHWSGGMAQYLAWAGDGPIPYPPPHPGGSWGGYQKQAARFYSNDAAKQCFQDLLRFLVPQLKGSPSVIWELANEPRGINNVGAFQRWINETAGLIKTMAPGQLVTTGSEGQTPSPFFSGTDVVDDHESPHIDFVTFHLWAQNWGWIKPGDIAAGFTRATDLASRYINDHARRAARLGKPILLEEFGFPRDGGSFDPRSTTVWRDRYFQHIYALVQTLMRTTTMAGIMPWAWSGDTRPPRPGGLWKVGDPFIGDPPHEPQGWYGIYDNDSTLDIVKTFAGVTLS